MKQTNKKYISVCFYGSFYDVLFLIFRQTDTLQLFCCTLNTQSFGITFASLNVKTVMFLAFPGCYD